MTLILKRTENDIDRIEREGINGNWTKIENNFNNVVQTIADKALDQVVNSARLIWQEPVPTFSDLQTTYPNAIEGWAAWTSVSVNGVNSAYRYNGSEWVKYQDFSGDAIGEVDNRLTNEINVTNQNLTDNVNALNTLNVQFMERGVDIKTFGAIGDGISNDTIAIQAAFDSGQKLFWSNGTYLFDRLLINNSNTVIDFDNNVTLQSSYAGDEQYNGAIEIKGTTLNSYNVTADIIEGTRNITLNNVSGLSIGDSFTVSQNIPTGTARDIHRQKYIHFVGTIQAINGNIVTTNESIPHGFQLSNSPKLNTFNPITNVKIRGNSTLFDKNGTTQYANHFFIQYAQNLDISGFNFIRGGGKGIAVFHSMNFSIKDIVHSQPSNVTAGHGYGVQISYGSNQGIIERVRCFESRHGIDFSFGSNNVLVKDCEMFNADYYCHGMNSKYITFENCTVTGEGFRVGNNSFLSDEKIKFINCVSKNGVDGFGVQAQSFDIDFINCEAQFCSNAFIFNVGTDNITLNNVKALNCRNFGFDMRGNTVRGNGIEIINPLNRAFSMTAAYNIELSNVLIDTTTIGVEMVSECYNIVFNKLIVKGAMNRAFFIRERSRDIFISESDIDISNAPRCIEVVTSSLTNVNLNISNCTRLMTSGEGNIAVFSAIGGVKVLNNNLYSDIQIENSPSGCVIQNNNFNNVDIRVRTVSNTMITNNYGTTRGFLVPTNNDVDVIIKNNITNLI